MHVFTVISCIYIVYFFYDYYKGTKGNWRKKRLCYNVFVFTMKLVLFIFIDLTSSFFTWRIWTGRKLNSKNFKVYQRIRILFLYSWTKNNFLLNRIIKFTIYLHPYVHGIYYRFCSACWSNNVYCYMSLQIADPSHHVVYTFLTVHHIWQRSYYNGK